MTSSVLAVVDVSVLREVRALRRKQPHHSALSGFVASAPLVTNWPRV